MDVIENVESEFSLMQKVQITEGLFKGHYGIITGYDDKKKQYTIEIMINSMKKYIGCRASHIRLQKTFLWFK